MSHRCFSFYTWCIQTIFVMHYSCKTLNHPETHLWSTLVEFSYIIRELRVRPRAHLLSVTVVPVHSALYFNISVNVRETGRTDCLTSLHCE
ncbi:hypothetical protein PM082_024435 [Marasmius tenuissimus]|nr:hypothetical protein PM082_024435 [Marasmius tenuissimus]